MLWCPDGSVARAAVPMLTTPTRIAAEALRLVPRKTVSRAVGGVAAIEGSPKVVQRAIDAFVRAYGVDVAEAVVPEGGYRSFNEFFTRALVPGARPLDPDPNALLSPADGKLEDFGPVERGGAITIKGKLYDVAELLGGADLAAAYEGGTYYIVYLSPRDYHRVHAPVTGRVTHVRHVEGTLYPVNSIGTDHVHRVFARNERVVVVQRSAELGDVATVLVGAIGVGRIGLAFDSLETNVGRSGGDRRFAGDGPMLERGGELGRFNLGSTVIGFVPRDVHLGIVPARSAAVRMGRALGRKGPT